MIKNYESLKNLNMKKIILLLIIVGNINTVLAQQDRVPDTDSTKKSNVEKITEIDSTDSNWQPNNLFKATHPDAKSLEHIVFYGKNGEITKTQYPIISTKIPVTISDYYKKMYPTEKTFDVWMEEVKDNNFYYILTKNEKLYFDKNGKYLKSEKMESMSKKSY
jgi:hypothetical protein